MQKYLLLGKWNMHQIVRGIVLLRGRNIASVMLIPSHHILIPSYNGNSIQLNKFQESHQCSLHTRKETSQKAQGAGMLRFRRMPVCMAGYPPFQSQFQYFASSWCDWCVPPTLVQTPQKSLGTQAATQQHRTIETRKSETSWDADDVISIEA